jgi:hypothetical protein
MATIEVRGYVNNPEVKVSAGGKSRVTFDLGVKQKEKAYRDNPEKITWANFRVTHFGATEAPVQKSFATVKGYLNVREFEYNGVKRKSLDITVTEMEIAPPFSDAAEPPVTPAASGQQKPNATVREPWDE